MSEIKKQNLNTALKAMLHATTDVDTRSPLLMTIKIGEEFGEFCEAVLVETGNGRHKMIQENSIYECADMMIASVATLAKLYPNVPYGELLRELTEAVIIKTEKYKTVLRDKE